MAINAETRKNYRTIGHKLKPVVTIAGNGLSENVLEELNRALDDHELIKVKLAITDRDIRKEVAQAMCTETKAELIQEIGKVALIFREAKKPNMKLSHIR